MNINSRLKDLGIDVDTGVGRFAGKSELYYKTLGRFAKETLETGVNDIEDSDDFASYIHALKGVTANLAIDPVHDLVQRFEVTLRAKELDISLYEGFRDKLLEISNGICEILADVDSNAKANSDELPLGSEKELSEILRLLSVALVDATPSTCEDLLKKLQQKRWDEKGKSLVAGVTDAIEGYDYEAALELLGKYSE